MSARNSKSQKLSLDELVFGALSQLQVHDYDQRSIRRYQTVWRKLITFARRQGYKGKLREQLILDFLAHHEISAQVPVASLEGWKKHAEHALKLLWHYARFGYFERGKQHAAKLRIPSAMQKSLRDYTKYCEEERYLSPRTVNDHVRQVGIFLDFLGKRDVDNFSRIRAEDLSDFVYSLSRYRRKTVAVIVSCVRQYLRFLFYKRQVDQDLSDSIPGVCLPEGAAIPSAWDKELLARLLDRIDRHSPRGKRDYAVLLLACRLGLRSSDIRALTLDHIDWAAETITFTQVKTGMPLRLPLTNEVGNALIDYLRSVRPETQYREVFLSLRPPFKPFSKNTHLHHIVKYWRELAGIQFKSPQRQGLHSLRHSLATHLLDDGAPFSLIAEILGHASTSSTMIYAKASVESLRQVALSTPEVRHVNEA